MYFGDYLIEKKVITSSQLIEALAWQLEHLPSMIRIIFESKVVPADELLSVIKSQIKQDIDLFAVLISQKKLTQKEASEMAIKQWERRLPLGEVLVKLNMVSKDQIDIHLDAYFEAKENEAETQAAQSQSLISDAALESLRELGIDPGEFGVETAPVTPIKKTQQEFKPKDEVSHFLNVYNEKQKNKMLKIITLIEQACAKSEEVGNYTNSLFRDLHLIKGAVFLADINGLENATTAWDESLETVLVKGEGEISKWCSTHLKKFASFLESLWIVREKVAADNTDAGINEHFSALKDLQANLP